MYTLLREFFSDKPVENIYDIPYTVSFVFRKRKQYLDMMQLPEEKRPPEPMFWLAPPEDIEEWLDRVLDNKNSDQQVIILDDSEFG